jgi:hypothetical protein
MNSIRDVAFLVILVAATVGIAAAQDMPKQRIAEEQGSPSTKQPPNTQQYQGASKDLTSPMAGQPSPKMSDDEAAKNSEDIEIQRKIVKLTKWLAIFGGLQFLALIVQAVVFYITFRAVRDTSQRQLRAYVLVSSALLKFKRPDAPEVQVHFKNYGQTPAYEMRGWISIWIEKYPLKITLPEAPPDFRKATETLAPSRVSIFVTSKSPPVQAQYIRLLGTPEGTVYVYGEIRYKDAFGTARWTKYRLMYGGGEPVQTSTADGYKSALLKPDVEGNESN